MLVFILKRLLYALVTLFGITLITFCIIQLAPGDPTDSSEEQGPVVTFSGTVSAEIQEQTRRLYGLDKPLLLNLDVWRQTPGAGEPIGFWNRLGVMFTDAQYPRWLGHIVRWDFGESFQDHRPVSQKIWEALRISLVLQIVALVLIYAIAIPLGVLAAVKQGTFWDRGVTIVLFMIYSLPVFWVATLLIVFLGGGEFLNLFPPQGLISPGAEAMTWIGRLLDRLWHLVLPVACLTYGGLAYLSRYMRSGMLEVVRQDYIRTARAKGLSEWTITYKHAFRNAVFPLITHVAHIFPGLIGGSVIVETIFNIPGMGRLIYDSFLARDYPVIMAVSFLSAALVLLGMIVSDLLYMVVDPRVSLDRGAR